MAGKADIADADYINGKYTKSVIIGRAVPQIESLELKALTAGGEEDDE